MQAIGGAFLATVAVLRFDSEAPEPGLSDDIRPTDLLAIGGWSCSGLPSSGLARTGPALAHSGRIHKASGSGICRSSLPPAYPRRPRCLPRAGSFGQPPLR